MDTYFSDRKFKFAARYYMYRLTLVSFLLSVVLLPGFNQQITENELDSGEAFAEYPVGITSFSPTYPINMLDSVIHFEFKEGQANPNISRRIFIFDESYRLDSIEELYQDRIYDYVSGYTIRYNYDASGRVSEVAKDSWNSSIEHLAINIREDYEYGDEFFRRISNISWLTASDTSSLDVNEEYEYDDFNQLVDYTMIVPPEINPEPSVYSESYRYDSIGLLTYESKDLSESGQSLSLTETRYQNIYDQDSLPQLTYATMRKDEVGDWNNSGILKYFYDDLSRNFMRAETKATDTGVVYEKQIFSFDQSNNITKKVRYISSDSVQYYLADSILYYHSIVASEDVEEDVDEEVEEEVERENPEEEEVTPPDPSVFSLLPSFTSDYFYIHGIDSPFSYRVVDASGRIILQDESQGGVTEINLSQYPVGYYIVVAVNTTGYKTGKVFKY